MNKTALYESNGKLNMKKIEMQVNGLKVIAHPMRYAIMLLLLKNKSMNVTEIYEQLKIDQAVTSNHLKVMKYSDILCSKRNGENIFYSINFKRLKAMQDFMNIDACQMCNLEQEKITN